MKKGITLIEILVTSLILVIGMSGMMLSFVSCRDIAIKNSHKHNCGQIIEMHFEELQLCDSDIAVDNYLSYYGLDNGRYEYRKSSYKKDYHRYFIQISKTAVIPTTLGSSLTLLTAEVFWNEDYYYHDPNLSMSMQMLTNSPN